MAAGGEGGMDEKVNGDSNSVITGRAQWQVVTRTRSTP